ncbi:MAG: hypothetical protein NC396_02470 [Bacteroides sp.]|nr:hypothetical protein [Bacteroides sp.]MCM1085055.1 hypothetical protein [Bacteroides sp.]
MSFKDFLGWAIVWNWLLAKKERRAEQRRNLLDQLDEFDQDTIDSFEQDYCSYTRGTMGYKPREYVDDMEDEIKMFEEF